MKAEDVLIAWTRNWYRDGATGDAAVITHATTDGWRGLCGVKLAENMGGTLEDAEPGCIRCRNALRKVGLMPAAQP